MSMSTTINTTLVWILGDKPSPADQSKNLIRANAAAWGHRVRRHNDRTSARNGVPLAIASHLHVFGYAFWDLEADADQFRSLNGLAVRRGQLVGLQTTRIASQ
jgi:hypothetical protein